MGELLELLEAESAAPEDLAEYSCLYIKYLQVRVNAATRILVAAKRCKTCRSRD